MKNSALKSTADKPTKGMNGKPPSGPNKKGGAPLLPPPTSVTTLAVKKGALRTPSPTQKKKDTLGSLFILSAKKVPKIVPTAGANDAPSSISNKTTTTSSSKKNDVHPGTITVGTTIGNVQISSQTQPISIIPPAK